MSKIEIEIIGGKKKRRKDGQVAYLVEVTFNPQIISAIYRLAVRKNDYPYIADLNDIAHYAVLDAFKAEVHRLSVRDRILRPGQAIPDGAVITASDVLIPQPKTVNYRIEWWTYNYKGEL
jgi:hypothetical protein